MSATTQLRAMMPDPERVAIYLRDEQLAAAAPVVRLYHGAALSVLHPILAEGIKPRGGGGVDNWTRTVSSNPRTVYLTSAYPFHFALNANDNEKRESGVVVFEVDHSLLDEERLHADEDALEQAGRGFDKLPKHWDMKRRTEHYRKEAHRYGHTVSLNALGTCGHRGNVPPHALTRYAVVRHKLLTPLAAAFDPSISITNFMYCGGRYRAFVSWLFGDRPDCPWTNFPTAHKYGIQVRRVKP